jgi:hypothetical protein
MISHQRILPKVKSDAALLTATQGTTWGRASNKNGISTRFHVVVFYYFQNLETAQR